jgi:hypothetical protein
MIYKKLLEFQKQGISIKKNSINPHFKNEYADLNEVLDKVKKPLNDMGVVIIQTPEIDGLRTRLVDTEGIGTTDEVSCFVPYTGVTDMQKLGGAITYAKRYSLIALLALEDEDKDGENAVSQNGMQTGGGARPVEESLPTIRR